MAKISIFEKGLLLNNLSIINQALSWFQTDISPLRGHLYLFNEECLQITFFGQNMIHRAKGGKKL